jgi:Uma2 family endonuclease
MDNDDTRKEVPMTAQTVAEVLENTRGRPWTWADLQDLPDGHRYEIIDGSLLVSASPTPWHQLVGGELVAMLRPTVPADLAVLETVDVVIRDSVLEPDVLIVRRAAITREAKRFEPQDVVMVVEVESPSSRRFDRLVKPSVYAEAGIEHYWRVDLDQAGPTLVLYELAGSAYRMTRSVPAGESVQVNAPFPVELRPADLIGPRRRD